ncbi:MAG: hypothetical protein QW772_00210 [Zestosphaera sp.]
MGYENARLVALVGPRRAGKTSLILSFLDEYSIPHMFVDCWAVPLSEYGVSFRRFAEDLSSAVNAFLGKHERFASRLLGFLKGVNGVEVDASVVKIFLRWRRERFSVAALLERLNTFAGHLSTPPAPELMRGNQNAGRRGSSGGLSWHYLDSKPLRVVHALSRKHFCSHR